jgi:hypothetical protein
MTGSVTTTPQGPENFNANYEGDPNFNFSTANAFVQVDIPDFTLNLPATPLVITAGQPGTLPFTVTPASNSSSPVTLSCGGLLPAGYVCSFQPPSVNLANGTISNATLTLTLQNQQGQAARAAVVPSKRSGFLADTTKFLGPLEGLGAITAFLLLAWPGKRRHLRAALGLGLACIIVALIGCGGGSSYGGGSGGGGGGVTTPLATTTTLASNMAKVGSFAQVVLTATVSGQANPTGTVSFNYNGGTLGQAILANGIATFQATFSTPGVYPITAQYLGDSKNASSTSMPLSQGVTGNVFADVVGQTGTLAHASSLTITVQ